jgi:magnesium chelatase subunit I
MGEERTVMNENSSIYILPYTAVVGQQDLKLALELAYIAPRIGGVLIKGERGTGKSTVVRAFAQMMYGAPPITIPINATEDRVVGGWQINELMSGKPKPQVGLLEDANGKLLYVDEVNLLDDHIVNIILDVTSTGILVIQREGQDYQKQVQFTLVGTMNPEEGNLRPQLLDRFGLMVAVTAESDADLRQQILQAVLDYDEALFKKKYGLPVTYFEAAYEAIEARSKKIEKYRERFYSIEVPKPIVRSCVQIAKEFKAEGHRGDYILVLAARAYAAHEEDPTVRIEHVKRVAPLVLQHRRPGSVQLNRALWTPDDEETLTELLSHA